MILFLILFVGLPLLGWFVFTSIFDAVTGYDKPVKSKDTYITNHYHDNRSVHIHTNQETKDLEH